MDVARWFSFLLAIISFATFAGCQSGPFARDGGVIGGLTGAALGAAVGNKSGNALPGAAIGAVAGSLTGNAVGGSIDDRFEAQQAAFQQQTARGAVTIPEVIDMSRNGLGEEVISTHIRNYGIDRNLTTDDLILLKNQGVSDRVISTMQSIGTNRPMLPANYAQPAYGPPVYEQPVIIERHLWGPPVYPIPYRHGCRPYPYHHGAPGWGVSFSSGF